MAEQNDPAADLKQKLASLGVQGPKPREAHYVGMSPLQQMAVADYVAKDVARVEATQADMTPEKHKAFEQRVYDATTGKKPGTYEGDGREMASDDRVTQSRLTMITQAYSRQLAAAGPTHHDDQEPRPMAAVVPDELRKVIGKQ